MQAVSPGDTASRSRDEEGSSGGTSYAATQATESTEVQTSLENVTDVNLLEKHCHELRHTLDNVKDEILNILSEKKACTEENCTLKQKIEDLSRRLPKTLSEEPRSLENPSGPLTYTITDVPKIQSESKYLEPVNYDIAKDSPQNVALKCFPFMNRTQKITDSPYCLFPTKDKQDSNAFKFENLSQFAFELSQSLSDPNTEVDPFSNLGCKPLSPPCLNETDAASDASLIGQLDFGEMKCSDEKKAAISRGEVTTTLAAEMLEERVERLTKENRELREKCTELEAGLEMMRVEYEKCEDYWQGKLNEERAIFDQVSDLYCIDLIKMKVLINYDKFRGYTYPTAVGSKGKKNVMVRFIDGPPGLGQRYITHYLYILC